MARTESHSISLFHFRSTRVDGDTKPNDSTKRLAWQPLASKYLLQAGKGLREKNVSLFCSLYEKKLLKNSLKFEFQTGKILFFTLACFTLVDGKVVRDTVVDDWRTLMKET